MAQAFQEITLANRGSFKDLLREAKRLSRDNYGLPVTFRTPAGTKAVVKYLRRKGRYKFTFIPTGGRRPIVRQIS